jgi:opine dehydrogenase
VIHPAVTLLNAGLIDRTGGDFSFYEKGSPWLSAGSSRAWTGSGSRSAAALEVPVLSEPALGVRQGYMLEENYSTGYSTAPGFRGIRAQPQLDHRYLTEDVGYSLVLLTDLGRQVGVDTPVMDAVIAIASVVLDRDLRGDRKRTMSSLGLSDYGLEQLRAL